MNTHTHTFSLSFSHLDDWHQGHVVIWLEVRLNHEVTEPGGQQPVSIAVAAVHGDPDCIPHSVERLLSGTLGEGGKGRVQESGLKRLQRWTSSQPLLNLHITTCEHVRRGGVEERELHVFAWPRGDGLPVERAGPAAHPQPPLLEDGLVDDAEDGHAFVQQGDQGAEQGLACVVAWGEKGVDKDSSIV
jgi:hypothetical protein